MNKFEELEAKKAELSALAEAIENDDMEALQKGKDLKAEIEGIEAEIQTAQEKAAVLSSIGEIKKPEQEEKKMEGLELFVKQAGEVDRSVKGWCASGIMKKDATDVVTGVTLADIDKQVAPQPRRRAARDLFNTATISGNAITYFLQDAYEGTPAVTAEGALKPQNSTGFTPATLALSKIAAFIKETDEIVNDAPFLASEVQNALLYQLGVVEDSTIISAVSGTNGIQTASYGVGGDADSLVEGILYSIRAVKSASAYDASCIIINPADMFTLLTSKDSNGQYIGGGYFAGAYGNGGYQAYTTLWGLPVFESSAVSSGTVLIAAKQAVNVWVKGGVSVKLYEQNEDDAIYNRVTLLAEERIACAVKDLNGVVKLTSV